MNNRLKTLISYYLVSGLMFAVTISAVIVLVKYRGPVKNAVSYLQKTKKDLSIMKGLIADMDTTISRIKGAVPPDYSRFPQGLILIRLDDLKSRFSGAELSVTNIEDKGIEISLPVTIRSPMTDYTVFVNNVAYLQSLSFPFFQIKNISISQAQEKTGAAVTYSIEGALKMPGKI